MTRTHAPAKAAPSPAASPAQTGSRFSTPIQAKEAAISTETLLERSTHLGHSFAQAKFPTEEAKRPNRTGLPDNLKSGIEALSGISIDNVKVHYNSSQPEQLNALAYAQGSDIHVAPGQEQHLPHEAWHVVQQAQGRVKPTIQMKEGVLVNDDTRLEREADVMGAGSSRVFQDLQHTKGCACSSCALQGQEHLIANKAPSQSLATSANTASSSAGILQLTCDKGHPEHKAGKCPYGLSLSTYRLPQKHVKGYRGKGFVRGKTTQASEAVMKHIEEQLKLGTPSVTDTTGGDVKMEVPRKHRHRSMTKKTRSVLVHKSKGDGRAHDFFMKQGEPSESDSSESEKEEEEQAKEEEE